jgi:hypothetical protein
VVLSINVSALEGVVVGAEKGGAMAFAMMLDADENDDFERGAIAMFEEVPIGLRDPKGFVEVSIGLRSHLSTIAIVPSERI